MKAEDIDPYIEGSWTPERHAGVRREIDAWPFRLDGLRVLDLGSGPGDFADGMLDRGAAELVWHDINARLAASARERLPRDKVTFEVRDMMDLPYAPGAFDLIVLRGALHWARDERELLRRLSPLLGPRGWLVVQAINFRRVREEKRSLIRTVGHYASPFLAVALRRKVVPAIWSFEFLTRRRLTRAGFDVVEWRPPVWDKAPSAWFDVIARRVS